MWFSFSVVARHRQPEKTSSRVAAGIRPSIPCRALVGFHNPVLRPVSRPVNNFVKNFTSSGMPRFDGGFPGMISGLPETIPGLSGATTGIPMTTSGFPAMTDGFAEVIPAFAETTIGIVGMGFGLSETIPGFPEMTSGIAGTTFGNAIFIKKPAKRGFLTAWTGRAGSPLAAACSVEAAPRFRQQAGRYTARTE